jgi:hypothetical protein
VSERGGVGRSAVAFDELAQDLLFADQVAAVIPGHWSFDLLVPVANSLLLFGGVAEGSFVLALVDGIAAKEPFPLGFERGFDLFLVRNHQGLHSEMILHQVV